MAAAIPFAIKAAPYIASGVGSLIGKKLSGPSKEQKAGMAGTHGASTQLQQQGAGLTAAGSENLGAAGSYYRNILGSRSAATQSLAPEMTTALDFYKGAQGKIDQTQRGGARDYASAELERQKVGQMAGMLPVARANAAQGSASVGGTQVGQGVQAGAQGGYLANAGFTQGGALQEQQRQGGNTMGKFIFDILQGLGKGKGATGGIPKFNSTQGVPNFFTPGTPTS